MEKEIEVKKPKEKSEEEKRTDDLTREFLIHLAEGNENTLDNIEAELREHIKDTSEREPARRRLRKIALAIERITKGY